jgi:hypothetical protein
VRPHVHIHVVEDEKEETVESVGRMARRISD